MVRHPYRPGQHGQARHSMSDYGRQLQEKQKIQLIYGLSNRQMMSMFRSSSKEDILQKLETRLDRVVFLLGFAKSPRVARQLVSHGHITVNGRKVTIPSYSVKMKDTIAVRAESRSAKIFDDIQLRLKQYTPPEWLKLKAEELKGECMGKPPVAGVQLPFDINLVGQFYSR
jgi:small subunit ribosomal protein S4